jgi:hypothetical protein
VGSRDDLFERHHQPPDLGQKDCVIVGEGEGFSDHASINKSIFEIAVSSQELLVEEGCILDGAVEGDVEWKAWREMGEVDRL